MNLFWLGQLITKLVLDGSENNDIDSRQCVGLTLGSENMCHHYRIHVIVVTTLGEKPHPVLAGANDCNHIVTHETEIHDHETHMD